MFTLEQLIQAHSNVKSGADFPFYIKEIKELGVIHYEAFVSDGHIDYYGANDYIQKVSAKYDTKFIAENADTAMFKEELKAHQAGKTDYLTFITMCADTGIEKWKISLSNMTCTYFDKAGNEILVEQIPQVSL